MREVPLSILNRSRADMAHIRQSRPDSGLDIQVKVLNTYELFPFRLEAALCSKIAKGNPSEHRRLPTINQSERARERERERKRVSVPFRER
jgi:hypothetical protein